MPARRVERREAARPIDYLFLMRPAALVPLWIFYFAGYGLARSVGALPGTAAGGPLALSSGALFGLLAMTAALAGGYLLNQVVDREGDRLNRKLFLLSSGAIPLRHVWIQFGVLWALAAAFSLQLPWSFRWIAAASAALCVSYSLPPIQAKARFPLDLVWNGLGFGVLSAAAGWSAAAPLGPALIGACGCYALAVAGIIASTTVPDLEGDRASGQRTTAVAIGERGASLVSLALLAAAALVGAVVRDLPGLLGSAVSLPLLLRAHLTRARADRTTANQVGVAAFAVAVAARSLYPLILLAAVTILSRAYYSRRFGFSYPGPGTR
jgi:4-hydroxybenzoate polyprenyltransferase